MDLQLGLGLGLEQENNRQAREAQAEERRKEREANAEERREEREARMEEKREHLVRLLINTYIKFAGTIILRYFRKADNFVAIYYSLIIYLVQLPITHT